MKAHFYKERKEIETNNQTIEDFLHEASIMRQFDHPNVLSIYGVSVHKEKPCVLLPLMVNRDLQKYLKDNCEVSLLRNERNSFLFIFVSLLLYIQQLHNLINLQCLSCANLFGFAIGVAKGMHHLADKKLVHCDLAARNCM